MTPETLFHQLLGLGDEWRVNRCEYDPGESKVRLWVEDLPHFWVVESARQRQAARCYDHAEKL